MQYQVRWSREYALWVLGLPDFADQEQIKKAYHVLCKKYHPDNRAGTDASEKMDELYGKDAYLLIQSAYEYLMKTQETTETTGASAWGTMHGPYAYQDPIVTPHPSQKTKIIGTGSNPERERCYEQVRQSSIEREKLRKEAAKNKQNREENVRRKEQESLLEKEKRKREIESSFYRLMEAARMLEKEQEQTKADHSVYAKKKAYEAFQKYEERNKEW